MLEIKYYIRLKIGEMMYAFSKRYKYDNMFMFFLIYVSECIQNNDIPCFMMIILICRVFRDVKVAILSDM